jgi:hypothetical protein
MLQYLRNKKVVIIVIGAVLLLGVAGTYAYTRSQRIVRDVPFLIILPEIADDSLALSVAAHVGGVIKEKGPDNTYLMSVPLRVWETPSDVIIRIHSDHRFDEVEVVRDDQGPGMF